MSIEPVYLWGILIAVLIGCELLTGTFYLLMIALGAVVGLLGAILGLSASWQLLLAAIACIAFTGAWHYKRYKDPKDPIYSRNKNALIDIGETVEVSHWQPNRSAQVRYRGADWTAIWVGQGEPSTGICVIKGMRGNQLEVDSLST